MKDLYDFAVLGAGPGGYTAALEAADLGLSVTVIEKDLVGGTCLNRGCIPTKAMLHACGEYRRMKNAEEYGIRIGRSASPEKEEDVLIDARVADGIVPEQLFSYRDGTVAVLRSGIEKRFRTAKIDLFRAEGRLTEDGLLLRHTDRKAPEGELPGEAFSDGDTIHARNILLAAGSKPSRLPVPGMDLPGVLTSDDLLSMRELPESIVIIGGGVIGCEFACLLSDLGISVTILEALPRILCNMDREISQSLRMVLKKRGVDIHAGITVSRIERSQDARMSCRYTEAEEEKTVTAQYILCAAGRRAVSAAFPALQQERGRILTDGNLMTSRTHVYAAGDLIPGIQLAHSAEAEGKFCARLAAADCGRPVGPDVCDRALIPSCIYTDPEIACVGQTEEEAAAAGIAAVTGKAVTGANARSVITKEERGFMKIVAEKETGRILGAQYMCARASDMIGEMTLAIANGLTVSDCLKAVRPHPTYEELLTDALESAARHGAGGLI